MANWNREQTAALISFFAEEPILYNISDSSYLNKVKKNDCFNKIYGKLVQIKPDTTIRDIKNKLKTLQTQYNKEKNLILKSQKSGAGTDEIYIPKLWCFEELKFWDNYSADEVQGYSNINLEKDSDKRSDHNLDSEENSNTNSQIFKNTKKPTDRLLRKAEESLDFARKYFEKENESNVVSPLQVLANMVISDLNGVSEEVFLDAKSKILDVLKEAVQKQMEIKKKNSETTTINNSTPIKNGETKFTTISSSSSGSRRRRYTYSSSSGEFPPIKRSSKIEQRMRRRAAKKRKSNSGITMYN